MENTSSLKFMTCAQLREAFQECQHDINKRILIIDVRNKQLFEKSCLCLDVRNNIPPIKRKMRVMNIDPDLVEVCTVKNVMSILNQDDLKIFKNRKDATEVVVIDSNTDDINQLSDPKSKTMRIINALTKFDNQPNDKIVVPIHILEGGFREWLTKYPHFTTDPSFDPDTKINESKPRAPHSADTRSPTLQVATPSAPPLSPLAPIQLNSSSQVNNYANNFNQQASMPMPVSPPTIKQPPQPERITKPQPPIHHQSPLPDRTQQPQSVSPQLSGTYSVQINKPTPKRVVPSAPKPSFAKNAPGHAVPVTPASALRSVLPRSHSSPNVAQADGDDFNEAANALDKLGISNQDASARPVYINHNNNNLSSNLNNTNNTTLSGLLSKPRFDRALKPTFNNESITAIRAQLDFGRAPEASGKAITGLQNLGNTCFMNSVIQCLAYARGITYYFCSDAYYNHINFNSQYGSKGELAVEFGALVEKLNSHRHRYIEPRSFRNAVVKHIGFAGNEQQDSHEFMMMLFDKLHHDLNIHARDKFNQNGISAHNGSSDDDNINIPRATLGYQFWKRHLDMNKSIISDLFEGIFMSTLTCTYCKGQSNTFEVFNCLSLPIPSDTRCHVRDCLSHFSNPERIEAAWECPRCKQKREADKKIVICKLPKILIIHLKRFSLDGRWRQKLQTTVDFPLTDLVVDCTTVLPQSAYGSSSVRSSYNLYAVVNHYGHLDGGHYTAYCKLENMRWFTFDDSNVSEMKDTDVCGQAAYILFYGSNQ